MKKWSDVRENIQSLSPTEVEELDFTVRLVSELIKRRTDLGYSQRDLAELSGIKQPAIARLETGGVIPRIDTLYKLLKPLGLTIKLCTETVS